MTIDLQAIKALADAATPGPWEEVAESGEWWITGPDIENGFVINTTRGITQANADFIAAAREAVPALLAEVERLTAEVGEMDALADEMTSRIEYMGTDLSVAKSQRDEARREVERLTALLSDYASKVAKLIMERNDLAAKWSAEHDAAVRADEQLRMARAELASYKRNAAYISSVIESEGVYRP